METFNLFNKTTSFVESFVKKYVTAMAGGTTHYINREQYRWWEFEDLLSSPDDDWSSWSTADKSLPKLLIDASSIRQNYFRKIKSVYGIDSSEAKKILKTYIGYHPSYGGYICQIAPYFSKGGGHGAEHIKKSGLDKFYYFIWRKRKATQKDIMESLARNIERYNTTFGIQFDPSDFAYNIRGQAEVLEETQEDRRNPNKQTIERVPNLDPNHPSAVDFYQRAPMVEGGSTFEINNNGILKILSGLIGPWYKDTLKEKMRQEGKSQKEINDEILSDIGVLKDIYNKSYQKWEEAKQNGSAAALGMSPPPKFLDTSLRSRPGAQWFTELETNDAMKDQMALRIQIGEILKKGQTDSSAIAKILNDDPIRVKINYRRKYKKPPLPPIIVTPQEVERHIQKINEQMQEKNQDISQTIGEMVATSNSMMSATGYDDLKTAFEMAAMYFSSEPMDIATKTRLGPSNAVAFNPPENFENYTSEDLMRWREEKAARDGGISPQPSNQSTPEDIARDIGKKMPDSEKSKPTDKPSEQHVEVQETSNIDRDLEDLMGKTVQNLIKVAEELDSDNKDVEAEEVHKIIRKYIERP